jgi:F0F1-type ATP synthase alpha subunit
MSSGNRNFDQLVAAGNPVGEVISIEQFLIRVHGLQPCAVHALILFEDGSKGFVHQVSARILLDGWFLLPANRLTARAL